MAIKGYLNDIKFVEVLKLTGKYNGRLGVWNFSEKKQYECFFQDENVVYLNFNGSNVTSADEMRKHILDLSNDTKSYYAFQPESLPKNSESMVSISELVEYSLSKSSDNLDESEELPNLLTKFEAVNKEFSQIQGVLGDFWEKTFSLFQKGCSGYEICDEFNYSELLVKKAIYKLRTLGVIRPVRMFKSVNPALRTQMLSRNLSKIANGRKNIQQPIPSENKNNSGSDAQFPHGSPTITPTNNVSKENINQFPPMPPALQNNTTFENIQIPAPPVSHPVSNTVYENNIPNVNRTVSDGNFPRQSTNETRSEVTAVDSGQTVNLPQQNEKVFSQTAAAEQTNNYSGRQGLIKRMLNSLFRS